MRPTPFQYLFSTHQGPIMRTTVVVQTILASICSPFLIAQAPQYTVVPSSHASMDAPGLMWMPGASRPLRQQQILSTNVMQSLVGKTLTALEFRRDAGTVAFQGGSADFVVNLSMAPAEPLDASPLFANNAGSTPVSVFSGTLQFPASPAAAAPTWSPTDVLRIPFQVPFLYQGGPLCIDIVGTPIAGQAAGWWPADAAHALAAGTLLDLGGGCGSYGGATHQWSAAEAHTLVPGGNAHFVALGPVGGFGLIAFGPQHPTGWPLAVVLPQAATGCVGHIDSPFVVDFALFEPYAPGMGRADYYARLPAIPTLTGASLTTQWIEWSQATTSNAIRWTLGNVPNIEMAHLDGYATDLDGQLFVHQAHVVRFEHD
jgi:hypothetical protein